MQGQGSVLYHQPRMATPSERLFAAQHRERLARMVRKPLPQVVHSVREIGEAPRKKSASEVDEIQRIAMIKRATLHFHPEVSAEDLAGESRLLHIVIPRQIAMYLSRKMTRRSLPDIARRFGKRDHTTVHHAVKKIKWLIETDPRVGKEIEQIEALLAEGV